MLTRGPGTWSRRVMVTASPEPPSLSAMKRVLVTVVGAVVLAFLIVLPALGIQATTRRRSSGEETTITEYDAVYDVAADGDLAVTETLHVDFPFGDKHGIFRFFDRHDPSATHALRTPHDIAVTMDGQAEPFSISHESHDRYVVARIGDPDVLLPSGTHVYTISYRIDGVLEPGTDGARTQFYWNVIPGGWAQYDPGRPPRDPPAGAGHTRAVRARQRRDGRLHGPAARAPPRFGSTAGASRRTRR